jgi:hypothetical protein
MCVIVYKPKGEKKVPKRILQECWRNNDDGAGYAIWNAETDLWDVKKGFMSFRKFWKSYRKENVDVDTIALIHFRIGTSGNEIPALTHPFPVTDKLKNMGELEYSASDIVFHNGVIGFGEEEWSDTCVAVRDIVDPLHPYLDDDKIFNFMTEPLESHQNRWIITKGGQIFQYGRWETQDGIDYSNKTYKESRFPATTHSYDSGYDNFGFPTWENQNQFVNKTTGKFDWEKWEARGSKQTELPWRDARTVPPNEEETDDEAIVIDIDAEGHTHPEPAFNKDKAMELLCCPNCYHDKYLDNSPYNIGDTICLICGCVFMELTGEHCTFDHDIHDKWNAQRKELQHG